MSGSDTQALHMKCSKAACLALISGSDAQALIRKQSAAA